MALLMPPELLDLLTAQIGDPVELVTLVGQCPLHQVRGIAVSAGCVLDFVFDRQLQQLQIWPRWQLQTLARA